MRSTNRILGLSVALIFSVFSLFAGAGIVNAVTGQTTRVSVDDLGVAANSSATSGVLSADGNVVVFTSSATNLVPGVSGTHVYRHDRTSHLTSLVDLAKATLGASTGPSVQPTVSANGRYVAFASPATDLVDGDTNGQQDVFLRDMWSSTITLVSTSSTAEAGNGLSGLSGLTGAHELSDDGRYVVFTSSATNLVPGTQNGLQHVYVKAVTTGAIERVSVSDAGTLANNNSFTPAISGNGQFVAFNSAATNLSDVPVASQVYVRDLTAGTTTLETPGAAAVGRPSTLPTLSYDGRYLAFVTAAVLDTRDLDTNLDVYLRDRAPGGTTVVASLSSNAFSISAVPSTGPSISGDGRVVGFQSFDDKLVVGDLNNLIDVFLYDRDTQTVTLVSVNDDGAQANAHSVGPSVSFDGHLVLFGSTASNLVTETTPVGLNQLYVHDLRSNQAPVLEPFGKDYVLSESQRMALTWQFSDPDGSTSWNATVDYDDGLGARALVLNANKTFLLDHLWAPGAYDVTVEVTDDAGAKGSLVIHVVVSNVAPTVGLLSTIDLAFTRTLDTYGTFTDPGSNETYSAIVNYGDGTPAQALAIGPYSAPPLAAGSFTLRHSYANAGTYTVTVTVSDGNGGSTTGTMVVNVSGYSYEWYSNFAIGRNLPVKFTVRGPDGAFVLDRSIRVDIVDAAGNVVVGPYLFGDQPSKSVTVSNETYHVNVDARDLAPGAYWLRVQFSSPTLSGEFRLGTTDTGGSTTTTRSRTIR